MDSRPDAGVVSRHRIFDPIRTISTISSIRTDPKGGKFEFKHFHLKKSINPQMEMDV
jgi:hypothetical protein